MIDVNHLVFEYPGKRVLHDISFRLREQRVCALVGPNGAGKTTLLRCIAALEQPFAGSIHVDALDVHQHPRESHKKIGYLADFFGLYERLTVYRSLQYMAGAYGIPQPQQADAIEWVLEHLNLTAHRSKTAEQLSRGLRQRLGIAQAIIHQPKLLILDEPASGLDPEARTALSELMCELKQQGMTLLVSSHILAELEEYSDEMLIIRAGKIIEHRQIHDTTRHTETMLLKSLAEADKIQHYLQQQTHCTDIVVEDQSLRFTITADDAIIGRLLQDLLSQHFPIIEFYKVKPSMQQHYMQSISRH